MTIRAATAHDLPHIEALLSSNSLPLAGVSEHLSNFRVVTNEVSGVWCRIGTLWRGRAVMVRCGNAGLSL